MQQIALNCDLGEGFGVYSVADEKLIVPLIDQANIACGFHAGDPKTLLDSLTLCATHGLDIGAHPSYPDLQGFGRRSMHLSHDELQAILLYQISALNGLTKVVGSKLSYVKPHGALYNDMMKDAEVFSAVLGAITRFPKKLKLMVLATPDFAEYQALAQSKGVSLIMEAFADRRYTEEGKLTPRTQPGAVLTEKEAVRQAEQFITGHAPFPVDSLCVHGDTPAALHMVMQIRELLRGE